MLKPLLIALTIFGTQTAMAQVSYTTENQRLLIECRGYVDKFSIFIETVMNPKDPKDAVTSLEVGYVLKTWAPKQDFEWEEPEMKGGSVAIEGSVGASQGQYKYNLPWANGVKQGTTSFTTGIALKTGFVNGNVSLNCKVTLKQIKSKTTHDYE